MVVGAALAFSWSPDGSSVAISSGAGYVIPEGRVYLIPLSHGQVLPRIPAGGFRKEEEIASLPGAQRIETNRAQPGPGAGLYAYYRGSIQRNLYRVPIQ
ncbi:MAG: hypothetical protein JO336_14790 [Acidobacteriia bacterium]|nr:hypothetical protein [Terriglobia bacterium]MBV8905946.1 hypothetical protein [Terriglobia bacterium]